MSQGFIPPPIAPAARQPGAAGARGAAASTQRRKWLKESDPRWLRRLERGARVALWGEVAWLVGVGWMVGNRMLGMGGLQALVLPAAVVGLLQWISVWLLTPPEPGGWAGGGGKIARWSARLLLLPLIAATVIQWCFFAPLLTPEVRVRLQWPAEVLGALGTLQVFAFFVYLQNLAARLPDEGLQSRAGLVMWLIGVGQAGLLLGVPLVAGAQSPGGWVSPKIANGVVALGGFEELALIIGSVLYLLLLLRLRDRLGNAARAAAAAHPRGVDGGAT